MLAVPFRVSLRNVLQTFSLSGRRSRNKVSVGEPAEGSFVPYLLELIGETFLWLPHVSAWAPVTSDLVVVALLLHACCVARELLFSRTNVRFSRFLRSLISEEL